MWSAGESRKQVASRDERLFQCLDDGVLSVFLNEDIVWRHASLSYVDALAPQDTLRGRFEVTFRVDDDGGLAAELKRRSQATLGRAYTPTYLETDW